MIYSTRGIVLTHTKYAETSIICHVLTEQFGKQSYIINQVRSRKNKGKSIFLQPLTLVDLEVYHNPKKEIQRIKDFRVTVPFVNIPFDQVRRGLAFFIAEVLHNAFKEEEKNEDLFGFVYHSIEVLDTKIEGVHNFHLFFLMQLSRILGFAPSLPLEVEHARFFDMKEGKYCFSQPEHSNFLSPLETELFKRIQILEMKSLHRLNLSASDRNLMVQRLLEYYGLHMDTFRKIKSFDILRDVFRG